jgi:hypothetical protein
MAATLPDGSASNVGPVIQRVKSTATAPAPYWMQYAFHQSTRNQVTWTFRMPADYKSAPVLKVQAKTSATSGNTVFDARIAAITPGDAQSVDAKAFSTPNTSAATAVPAAARNLFEISIPLVAADGLAARDLVCLYLARAAEDAADTVNAATIEVVAVSLEYTT